MNGCIDHQHIDTSITPPSILRSLSRPIKDLIQQKEVEKQKNPSTKSYYKVRADEKRARNISAPSVRAHPSNNHIFSSSFHFPVSQKHTPANYHIKRIRHHLSHSILSSLESIGREIGQLRQQRECAAASSFVPFLISFFFIFFARSFLVLSLLLFPFVGFSSVSEKFFFLFSLVTRSMRRLEAHWRKRRESFFLFCVLCFVFSVSMMRGMGMLAWNEGRMPVWRTTGGEEDWGCESYGARLGERVGRNDMGVDFEEIEIQYAFEFVVEIMVMFCCGLCCDLPLCGVLGC